MRASSRIVSDHDTIVTRKRIAFANRPSYPYYYEWSATLTGAHCMLATHAVSEVGRTITHWSCYEKHALGQPFGPAKCRLGVWLLLPLYFWDTLVYPPKKNTSWYTGWTLVPAAHRGQLHPGSTNCCNPEEKKDLFIRFREQENAFCDNDRRRE